MSQITFIRILVGDAKKHIPGDQYSTSRKAEVELHSSVEEGEDAEAILNEVHAKADRKVEEILSRKPAAAPSPQQTAPASPAPSTGDAGASGEKKTAPKNTAAKKTTKSAAAKKTTKSAAAIEDEGTTEVEVEVEAEAEPEEEITDADLANACSKKNEQLKDGARIRAVTTKFVDYDDKPAKTRDIPQAKRKEFLEELAALK